jgi:CRP-like cAMP-binding protein
MTGNAQSMASRNRFLRALAPETRARLEPHLEAVTFRRRQQIYAVGDDADMVHFLDRGLVSLVKPMSDGGMVEVNSVGPEGAVCLSSMLGLPGAVLDSVVQIPGDGWRMKRDAFRQHVDGDPHLRDVVRRYAEFSLGQMAQVSACNALHVLEKRCCRWLLVAHDAAGADEFPLTHEYLALMLGVQRPGVSLVANALQKAGLIRYGNGWVTVLDRDGLEAQACECHRSIQARLDQLLGSA